MKAGLHGDLPSSLSSLEPFLGIPFFVRDCASFIFPLGEKHGFMYYTVLFPWQKLVSHVPLLLCCFPGGILPLFLSLFFLGRKRLWRAGNMGKGDFFFRSVGPFPGTAVGGVMYSMNGARKKKILSLPRRQSFFLVPDCPQDS